LVPETTKNKAQTTHSRLKVTVSLRNPQLFLLFSHTFSATKHILEQFAKKKLYPTSPILTALLNREEKSFSKKNKIAELYLEQNDGVAKLTTKSEHCTWSTPNDYLHELTPPKTPTPTVPIFPSNRRRFSDRP
jgi:hypothetical protein